MFLFLIAERKKEIIGRLVCAHSHLNENVHSQVATCLNPFPRFPTLDLLTYERWLNAGCVSVTWPWRSVNVKQLILYTAFHLGRTKKWEISKAFTDVFQRTRNNAALGIWFSILSILFLHCLNFAVPKWKETSQLLYDYVVLVLVLLVHSIPFWHSNVRTVTWFSF